MISHSRDLCALYPNVTLAKRENNDEILEFLKTMSMDLKDTSLDFSREPDYFKLQSLQGSASQTFLLRNQDGRLVGTAVMTSVESVYKGNKVVWAYSSDLRFSPKMERTTRKQFLPMYGDMLRNLKTLEDLNCPQFLLSIILDNNTIARRTLLNKKNPVIYRPVYQYQSRMLFAKLPSLGRSSVQVTQCRVEEVDALKAFLVRSHQDVPLSHTLEDIERRMKVLHQTWTDFSVAKENQEIVGAGLLTSDRECRKTILKFDKSFKLKVASFASSMLGQPKITDSEIRTSILAFATIKPSRNEDVLRALVNHVWPLRKNTHGLVFSEKQNSLSGKMLFKDGFLSHTVPGTMFQIIHRDDYQKKNLVRGLDKIQPLIETSFL